MQFSVVLTQFENSAYRKGGSDLHRPLFWAYHVQFLWARLEVDVGIWIVYRRELWKLCHVRYDWGNSGCLPWNNPGHTHAVTISLQLSCGRQRTSPQKAELVLSRELQGGSSGSEHGATSWQFQTCQHAERFRERPLRVELCPPNLGIPQSTHHS